MIRGNPPRVRTYYWRILVGLPEFLAAATTWLFGRPEKEVPATNSEDTEARQLMVAEQNVHASIDFRGIVPIFFVGTMFGGPLKDARTLIPTSWFLVVIWLGVASFLVASASIWVSLVLLRKPKNRPLHTGNLGSLLWTTVRKVISFNLSMVLMCAMVVAYAIGLTIAV